MHHHKVLKQFLRLIVVKFTNQLILVDKKHIQIATQSFHKEVNVKNDSLIFWKTPLTVIFDIPR